LFDETKVAAIQGFITLIAFLPFFLFETPDYQSLTLVHWSHLVFLGVVSSGVAFILYNYALKTIGGTVSSLGINFIPVFTLFFGFIFLGETMNWIQILGGLLIIILMGFTIVEDNQEVIREHE
jgi:drug/metabolite transporter (DMT)-like permease